MFVRFERVQRPQSFNDNPITSLSWMSNDDYNNFNSNLNNQNDVEQQQQPQQQQQQQQGPENHHHHHNHYHQQQGPQLFDEDSSISRDINNNNNHNHNGHQQHCAINERNKCAQNQQEEQSDLNESLDGWLAVGNCRGVVGVTYTTIDSQQSIINGDVWNDDGNLRRHQPVDDQSSMIINDYNHDDNNNNDANHIFHLQYNNYRNSQYYRSKVTTPIRSIPSRTNFNLRGHRSEIVFVRWNEPYQKLASCDRNGVIFVWIKYEGRWSIELINDRNTRVTDFAWSHDGRMALICYMDGFVLVGSVSGQRYWSSMLNLNECSITCGTWTPNNQNVLFGTSNGHILVISVHGVFITQISVQEGIEIIGLQWSCRKFMKKLKRNNRQQSDQSPLDSDSSSSSNQQQQQQQHMLAVSFVDGTVYLMRNYDEIFPCVIETSLINIKMEWSNNGEILAVGGHRLTRSTGFHTGSYYMYQNILRFYLSNGQLIKQVTLDFNWQPLSALTWACNDSRVFIACGQLLYVAWIIHGIPSLSFFSGLRVYNNLKCPKDIERLQVPGPVKQLLGELFTPTIHCYLPDYNDIGRFVFRPPPNNRRLHCTLMRHEDISNRSNADSIYILYLEYLGSLVPILKGKRSSKIKPEFVIFDPQQQKSSKHNSKCSKSSKHNHCDETLNEDNDCDGSNENNYDIDNLVDGDDQNSRRVRCLMANNCNPNNIGWIQLPSNLPPPPPPPQQLPPNENNLISNNNSEDDNGRGDRDSRNGIFMGHPPFLTPKTRRRLRLTRNRNHNNNNNDNPSRAGPSFNQVREPQQQQQQQQQEVDNMNDVNDVDAILMESSLDNEQPYHQQHHYAPWLDDLPEKSKIVLVTSNLWGTKFKFLSLTAALPSNLGSVSYKTSLLHLQPRQMSLVIKELNENNTRLGNIQQCHSKTKFIKNNKKNLSVKNGQTDNSRIMKHHNHVAGCSSSSRDAIRNDQFDSNSYSFQNFTSDESEDDDYEQLSLQQRRQQLQRIIMMKMNSDMDTDTEDISLYNNGEDNNSNIISMEQSQQPAIAPMSTLKTIRNSMLLSLNDLPQQVQHQQQQIVSNPIQQSQAPDLNTAGPSSGRNSNIKNCSLNNNNQLSLLSDEFLTLQIQQNDSGGSSYNLEIKPSSSSLSSTTKMSSKNCAKVNSIQKEEDDNDESLLSTSLSLPPPSPPTEQFPPMKTKRSNSNTMVRQFKHQTFQSESPKHVSSYYNNRQQQQQIQQSTISSPPTTPRQDQQSSPKTNSPSKQGSRSKISTLKESPRRNSSSVSYTQNELFQKKTGYIDNDDVDDTNGNKTSIGTSTTAKAATTCFEIAGTIGNDATASTTTATAATTYQTYHIYDDTDLVNYAINHSKPSASIPIDPPTNFENTIDANQLLAPLTNDFEEEDDDDSMATENYLKNVEQVVQSLSEKLQSKMILLQQTSLHQKNMQNLSNESTAINKKTMVSNSSLGCSNASSTASLFRSDSLPYHSQQQKYKKYLHHQQQQSNCKLATALSCSSLISTASTASTSNSINQNHELTQNKLENKFNRNKDKNHSLPASPLIANRLNSQRENNRRLSIDQQNLQSLIASNRMEEKEPRKSNGRHFFQSPKLVRKLRRKLSYLDCSSEDDNSDDDTDYGSIRTTVSDDNGLTDGEIVNGDNNDLVSIDNNDENIQQRQLNEKKRQFSNLSNLKRKHRKHRKHNSNDKNNNNNLDDDSKRFQLHNKAPIWNEVSQVYQLDFGGRVTQESAKNFQIEHQGKQVMQFGRIDTNAYTLDFEYPFSAIQAMAVALANVTQRLK